MPMSIFRRIMLGGGIDIDTLPDTHKLYYQATAKVTPWSSSLGAPLIANKWNANTGEGIIICIYNIGKIGNFAFYFCDSLTNVAIPDSVTEIGSDVFHGCSNLTSITIPDSVISIGSNAFYNCTSLTSVTIGNSVTSIGNAAFGLCTSMKSVTIGNGVTSIEKYAFYLCSSLTNVLIPDKVTSIGYMAFSGCHSLTNVTIPNSVTSIGSNAFEECKLLTSITIPNSVTLINANTFSKCTSMQYYDFSTHEIVPELTSITAFNVIPSTCKIIVPDSLYDQWIVAKNWSTYASNIIKKSDWDAQQVTE